MNEELPENLLKQIARELENVSEKLGADVRPGHVDYISKSDASLWIKILADQVRKFEAIPCK